MSKEQTLVLRNQDVQLRLKRMSWEILELHQGADSILLAGIYDRGFELANRIAKILQEISSLQVETVAVYVNKEEPFGESARLDAKLNGTKDVVLVDDVLNSGKTMLNALPPFLSQPLTRLSTLVLVDRNHNRYPVKADIVGMSLATTLQEHVSVKLGKEDAVYLR